MPDTLQPRPWYGVKPHPVTSGPQDIAHLLALIRTRHLGRELADTLSPYLRSKYLELIGLATEDERDFLARLDWLSAMNPGGVQAVAYTPAELHQLEAQHHLTVLEACDHGIVLSDNGEFAALRERHRGRVRSGLLTRSPGLWEIRDGRGR